MTEWIDKKSGWLGNKARRKPNKPVRDVNIHDNTAKNVIIYILRCPNEICRSRRTQCYSSNLPIRYHKCLDCGLNFKSVEEEFPENI